MQTINDPHFRVEVVTATPNPQQAIWLAAHQCVCEGPAVDDERPDETKAGSAVVKHLLTGDKGHYSPLESASITFDVVGFPHRVMQQATRHRFLSPSVQSFRYTGERISALGEQIARCDDIDDCFEAIESCFYLRPVGEYRDRDGARYTYTEEDRRTDIWVCAEAAIGYYIATIKKGRSAEQACGLLPMDTRQNWVVTGNLRAWLHFMDLRTKADSQLEIRALCDLIWPHLHQWAPAITTWYHGTRWAKARLAP